MSKQDMVQETICAYGSLWIIVLRSLAIEINLRQPSMLHGKKGFERIVWACKNVLDHSVSWLFHDFQNSTFSDDNPDPLAKHHPSHQIVTPTISHIEEAKVPNLTASEAAPNDEYWATEIHEWLSLIALQSPRVEAQDDIDPYLCRYEVPNCDAAAEVQDLVSVKWNGLLPNSWIQSLFVELW